MNTNTTPTKEGIDKRTIRAATESMSIDRHAGEPGEYDVYSESGSVYRVCLITETCDCPSDTYQDGACKHQRRVEMALGQRDVPELDEETDVELMIAAREQYRGLGDSTVEHRPADDAVVVTDGGVAIESATQDDAGEEARITGPHLEPPEQGGATYYRCEDCGRESLRRGDVERSEFHAEGCALR
ncbi:hypothetical protein HacjB3_19303 (plasmid) [Halalkalicoccus jeotgali B3]|uniref:SWIM-type domain-containing protein n=1 Tax=Halalkalicoccus jeotgali (strain DSM 18796 / CECT 7217 / JCM 14584 / KCTC 4019 / B3) TaxID=795797 RepID=D8JCQ8_HALJB|nr:hypothetical protein [Halalkalicoccus jeotgali]ADJ16803.1 hypothetical protein HacjB3_17303 [Halalkalicoccus jeotgali B3]ADJ17197.1 hypothetical protein HacjB3_19303 [Halalkalicoccus jeotgali B3]